MLRGASPPKADKFAAAVTLIEAAEAIVIEPAAALGASGYTKSRSAQSHCCNCVVKRGLTRTETRTETERN